MNVTEVEKKRSWHQRETEDSITFMNINMKIWYDWYHKLLTLKKKDCVFIKLHKEYKMQRVNQKLGQQCIRSFQVIEKIRKLAYQIESSDNWKIHNIISVVMLESALSEKRVVNKRSWQYRWSASRIEYLIKWNSWGSEWNSWMLISELNDVYELIENYNQLTVNHF